MMLGPMTKPVESNPTLQRDLAAMADETYDILVIGGGVSGATVAWDAALRGFKVALVEKRDFASATSAASSKLIHGGLRYLQNGEIRLVRESLAERRIWERIAPHMVDPLPFLIPVYHSWREKWKLRIGLTLYDILSLDRTWLDDPSKRLPGHRWVSPKEAISYAPDLSPEGLKGALVYFDCQTYAPERLALECILGAAEKGASVANYAEVTRFLIDGEVVRGAEVRDTISGETHTLRADVTINATGPWADLVLKKAEGDRASKHLLRSKGIHIITRALSPTHAFTLQASDGHLFVMPWRGKTLIGTTDTAFRDNPDEVGVTEADIAIILNRMKEAMPRAHITRADVLYAYAGLRPLIDKDGDPTNNDVQETYTASRAAEVADHEAEGGLAGLISALGGKWTTSRDMAKRVVDLAVEKLQFKPEEAPQCVTATTPTLGGAIGFTADFFKGLKDRHPGWDEETLDHLGKLYGARAEDVIALAEAEEARATLSTDQPSIEAEVLFAIRREMALTLPDVLLRRTEIGTLGAPAPNTLKRVSDIMAGELGWSEKEASRQREEALRHYQISDGTLL